MLKGGMQVATAPDSAHANCRQDAPSYGAVGPAQAILPAMQGDWLNAVRPGVARAIERVARHRLLALAIALPLLMAVVAAGFISRQINPGSGLGTATVPVELQDAAYQFGFAHAALAACPLVTGAGMASLKSSVQARADGTLPDGVKAGFAAFHELMSANGVDGACAHAEHHFGAGAALRANVLIPR